MNKSFQLQLLLFPALLLSQLGVHAKKGGGIGFVAVSTSGGDDDDEGGAPVGLIAFAVSIFVCCLFCGRIMAGDGGGGGGGGGCMSSPTPNAYVAAKRTPERDRELAMVGAMIVGKRGFGKQNISDEQL